MVLTVDNSIPITAKLGEDTTVDITGTDFSSPATVEIVGVETIDALSVNVISNTRITCIIPGTLGAGDYDLKITVGAEVVTLTNGVIAIRAFPVPPFLADTFNAIMTRILQRLPDRYDIREGSTTWDIIAGVALEIANEYVSINTILDLGFVVTTSGAYLDYHATEVGLTRLNAVKSKGTITITGANDTIIPKGSKFGNEVEIGVSPIEFETDAQVTISGGTASPAVTAVVVGIDSNVIASTITRQITIISGVTTVDNVAATTGGADAETDDELKARILRRVRQPSHGGNVGDYELWAAQASEDVGKIGIAPLGSGAGTVDVYILQRDNTIAPAALILIVQNFIKPAVGDISLAPIGADVTVASATLDTVDVAVDISALPGFTIADVILDVIAAIEKFLEDLPIGQDVLFFEVASTIQGVVGVNTMNTFTVDAGTADVTIAVSAKAMPGTITVVEV